MIRRCSIAALVALAAFPAAAFAKAGGAEGVDPLAPAPNVMPCVSVTSSGGGVIRGNKLPTPKFQYTNCSAVDEVVVPHYNDHPFDGFGLGRDCGPDVQWDGDAVSLPAGKSATVGTFAVWSACPSIQSHTITVTFTTPSGDPVTGIGSFGWSQPRTA